MHVVVVIVSYRSAGDVAGVLTALRRQSHRDLAVVVCENGGADAAADLRERLRDEAESWPDVRIVEAPDNPGYAGGVNRAMAASPDADAWWVLNPDTVPADDALERMVARLERGDVAAVGGVLHDGHGRVQGLGGRWRGWAARCVSLGNGTRLSAHRSAAAIEPRLDYLLGASMLVARAMVDAVGPMREDYFLYCEEVEWCLRARAAGLRFGFADAVVAHHQGASTGSGAAARSRPRLPIYLDERNKLHLVRDTRTAPLLVAVPMALVLLTLRYGKARAWRQWRHAFAGWRAALAGERGKPRWLRPS